MAVDPSLLTQALRTPDTADVTATPIVRAVILADPANAADLVPSLGHEDSLESRNARRVLCQFGPDAVPHLLAALVATGSPRTRAEGVEVLAAMLTMEDGHVVRDSLADGADDVRELLGDARPVPGDFPEHVEVDFSGRVCDLLYLAIRELLDTDFDQSSFRALDHDGRDAEIDRWASRGADGTIA